MVEMSGDYIDSALVEEMKQAGRIGPTAIADQYGGAWWDQSRLSKVRLEALEHNGMIPAKLIRRLV